MPQKSMTPWGPPQTFVEVAPGIELYTTAAHGGFWLSEDRRDELHWALPKGGQEGDGWYEEGAGPKEFSFSWDCPNTSGSRQSSVRPWSATLCEEWPEVAKDFLPLHTREAVLEEIARECPGDTDTGPALADKLL